MHFSLKALFWWMFLVAVIFAATFAIPPESVFSGPLYPLSKGGSPEDRVGVYLFSVLIMVAIAAYPAWPRVWTGVISLCGIFAWVLAGRFLRQLIDW